MERTKIDELLQSAVSEGSVPGVVALAANRDGIFYQGAFGCNAVDSNVPMTMDSVVWIASMSKAVTTVAAMQLVEKGLLELDEPMSNLFPQFASISVLDGFSADGKPRFRKPARQITLRHLLTHTSGFAYEIFNKDMLDYTTKEEIPILIACRSSSLNTPLVHDPGEIWEYGISVEWVGKAIEAVSGQSLEDYFKDNIFSLMDMNDTAFILSPGMHSRLAAMHQREADGSLARIDFLIPQEPESFMGGIGLYSTGVDYLKFLQMVLNGGVYNGVRILQPETVEQMGRNQIGDINVPPLISAIPNLSRDAELFPGIIKKWGLGFMLTTEDAPARRSAGSMSWVGLCNSFFWIDPTKQVTAVLLTQILPFADAQAMDLFNKFETLVYEKI